MDIPVKDLDLLLADMEPVLKEGRYVYASLKDGVSLPLDKIEASVKEQEGLSVLVSEKTASDYQLESQFLAAWITLNVHSDLAAVGLTAAFAKTLSDEGISCNVIAGYYHDHILVPNEQAESAMAALRSLQVKTIKEIKE